MVRIFRVSWDYFRFDGTVGKAGFDLVARVEGGGIADGVAIFESDAVASAKQQGGIEVLGFLLNELQTVLLSHQSTVEENGEAIL